MSAATVSRGARRFVAAGALLLVAWQAAALAGLPRRAGVALGLYGFVLHVVFGKAYALVPSYFERDLAVPRAPAVQLPLSLAGVAGLALEGIRTLPDGLRRTAGVAGAAAWLAGALVFLAAVGWTVRDNLTGAETGTGEASADRRPVDRAANAFVPVALAYLLAGAYGTLAARTALPWLDAYLPRVSHLLAAGFAVLLLFAVGFRLLPRFLVAAPPRPVVATVLPAGALGPALLAVGLPAGPLVEAGAALEAVAVLGFAAAFVTLYARSDRRRIGFYGPLAGVVAGVLGVGLGVQFAFAGITGLTGVHFRLNVLGFLGLTVVGVTYQFYPPAVGTAPGVGDRTALAALAALAAGLLAELVGVAAGSGTVAVAGRAAGLAGAAAYAYVLLALFRERYG